MEPKLYTFLPIEEINIPGMLCKEIPVAEEYTCIICSHIPAQPELCITCDSSFCPHCIKASLSITSTCPCCRKAFTSRELNRKESKIINSLSVLCLNSPNCDSYIQYDQYLNHLEDCKYTKRKAKCGGCSLLVETTNEAWEIGTHVSSCPSVGLVCEFCKGIVIRSLMDAHLLVCELRPKICVYCETKYTLQIEHSNECLDILKRKYESKKRECIVLQGMCTN
jgi:hypothetical protein